MARTRTTKRPPEEVPPAIEPVTPPEPAPEATPEPVIGVTQYVADAGVPPMRAAILTITHATTKATRSEWDALLARALTRPVP